MATIRTIQGPKGTRYTARIRFGGIEESKTFSTKTAAREWAKRREVELKEKPHLANSEAHKHTLGEAIDRYSASVLPQAGEAMRRDRPHYLAWWREHHGSLPLSMVQPPVLAEAKDRLARTPKARGTGTLAPATVLQYMLAIGHVLAYAVREWHWLPVNPMDAVSKPRVNNARTRYLDDTPGPDGTSELTRLLDACRVSESPDLLPYVLLSLVTGGRSSEVLGLTWGDVDLSGRTVTFRHTKNGDIRRVSITPELVDMLQGRANRGIGKALVFPSPNDPARPIDLRSAWETAIRRAGIEDFRPHDLRHSAASYLAMEGATLAELAGVLGHRTLAMVKRYSHLSPEHVATASERIGARIAAKTGGA